MTEDNPAKGSESHPPEAATTELVTDTPRPIGRPSKYQELGPEWVCAEAERLGRLGCTNLEIANYFEISEATFYQWKIDFPEFSEAVKSGGIVSDRSVANALYDKALGAEWVEEQAIKVKEVQYENGKRRSEVERVEIVEVTRKAPPDTTAQIFWLKNRRPDDWRDRKELHVNDERDPEDIAKRIAERLKKAASLGITIDIDGYREVDSGSGAKPANEIQAVPEAEGIPQCGEDS